MVEVVIYTTRRCSYCVRAKELLERRGAAYREVDVTRDLARQREMITKSGGRYTVPQIFIGGAHVGGSDDLHELDRRGQLRAMLDAGAASPRDGATKDGTSEERVVSEQDKVHEVVILGSGPAGLTAAIYCARANLEPVVVEGLAAGGQLMNTTEVENYPGFPEGLQGPEMMELFKKQAERFGTTFVPGDATRIEASERPFKIWVEERILRSRALIVATGASPRYLGVEGEKKYAGKGVSYCATCDGFFFRDQPIVVVGGGDSAMEEAMFLTRYGSKVTVIHRRDALRASKIMADRAKKNPKIEFVWDTVVEEVVGDQGKVAELRVRDVKTDERSTIECAGLFVAIGHVPNTKLFEGVLPVDEQGYLEVEKGTHTAVPGIFASGDAHDHVYRQAVTAAGEGCKAAIDCERWLESEGR